MGLLSLVLVGLVAGALARLVVPGTQRIGCLATIAVGIVGALIGGVIGEVVLDREVRFEFGLVSIVLAAAGAAVLLLAIDALGRRRL